MQLDHDITPNSGSAFKAGYACPCGCHPEVTYEQGAMPAHEGCCCGNQFAVGPSASDTLMPAEGFRPEVQAFTAPWGEALEAAWLVGPSVHGPTPEGDQGSTADESGAGDPDASIDPVCGMTVDRAVAHEKGLHSTHEGREYLFCGRGCKLEFGDDPGRYLDPSYVPSM